MLTEQALLIYSTFPSQESAQHIASILLEERLLACATLLPGANSMYWWEGSLNQATESILFGKTTQARYNALEQRMQQLHPYTSPCLIAAPITHGLAPYLQWLHTEVTPPNGDK